MAKKKPKKIEFVVIVSHKMTVELDAEDIPDLVKNLRERLDDPAVPPYPEDIIAQAVLDGKIDSPSKPGEDWRVDEADEDELELDKSLHVIQ
jgi:hypothetical protein